MSDYYWDEDLYEMFEDNPDYFFDEEFTIIKWLEENVNNLKDACEYLVNEPSNTPAKDLILVRKRLLEFKLKAV